MIALEVNPILREDPIEKARSLQSKIYRYDLLEKITFIAIATIAATVLFVSLFFAPSTAIQLTLFGLTLSTAGLGWAAGYLRTRKTEFISRVEIEEGVSSELRRIAEEDPNCQDEDKRGMARLQFWLKRGRELEQMANNDLQLEIQDPAARLQTRQWAYQIYEEKALPAYFNAVWVYHILRQPTTSISLNDIGEFTPKPYDSRQFDRKYPPCNNDYFVFKNGGSLTLTEVENLIHSQDFPHNLYNRLFVEALNQGRGGGNAENGERLAQNAD